MVNRPPLRKLKWLQRRCSQEYHNIIIHDKKLFKALFDRGSLALATLLHVLFSTPLPHASIFLSHYKTINQTRHKMLSPHFRAISKSKWQPRPPRRAACATRGHVHFTPHVRVTVEPACYPMYLPYYFVERNPLRHFLLLNIWVVQVGGIWSDLFWWPVPYSETYLVIKVSLYFIKICSLVNKRRCHSTDY